MVSRTNEQALEDAIEASLTGKKLNSADASINFQQTPYNQSDYFQTGNSQDFCPRYALDTKKFWDFLTKTQQDKLDNFKKYNSADWEAKIIERFDRLVKKGDILKLLRDGLKIDNEHFYLMYSAPQGNSSDTVKQNFDQNIFSVTRQVYFSADNNKSIDMVLFINGIPIITIELKNIWTGQTARYHAQEQYKKDRDPKETLFNFGRCLVHFAVDTEEAFMTTKLAGDKTFFLPFNKGHNDGKGNPPNPNGYKTAYLWEEIFTKHSLANIIQHFVRFDNEPSFQKRTLFFPRYHQLDVVRRLISHAENYGVGQSYLIQHSAGSGKSNSITWAAFQLIEAYPQNPKAAGDQSLDQPLFNSVIVVTDRRLLDKQLRDNISAFAQVKNIFAHANSSQELRTALETGKKIIITTIQKFPFIIEGISDLSQNKFAVIIDEAHSSQTGSAHHMMNQAMGAQDTESEEIADSQDIILAAMRARKVRDNASYFAFTATPKNSTLERFGTQQADGTFKPFHTYSMKQAIEEGFILDVLANYTTYRSYYQLAKSIEDNPKFNTKKAQRKLRSFVEQSQQTIDFKAEVMFEHFLTQVFHTKKLKNQAKGMVVTQSIESAIRYFHALKRQLAKHNDPFKIAIAFSGEKTVDGIPYTESDMNGFSEDKTRENFDGDEYRLLVVANKYLTGFDQPKLAAMYVDKKLDGVLCVQALSRLNRSSPKLNKKTEDLFILDFFNTTDDIRDAFEPFYTTTNLTGATDINVLHELKDELEDYSVYEQYEVDEFNQKFFQGAVGEQITPLIDEAAARFNQELYLEHEDKINFKVKAKHFYKVYSQVSALLPFENVEWEKLFWFLKFLIPKLNVKDEKEDSIDSLLASVDLSSYGLARVKLNYSIGLSENSGDLNPTNPNPRSGHTEEVEDPLEEIIRNFNERWFAGWDETPENQKIKFLNLVQNIASRADIHDKYINEVDQQNRDRFFERIVRDELMKNRRTEMENYNKFNNDTAYKEEYLRIAKYLVDQQIMNPQNSLRL